MATKAAIGLPITQAGILAVMRERRGPITDRQLGEIFCADATERHERRMTQAMAALVRRGLVDITTTADDIVFGLTTPKEVQVEDDAGHAAALETVQQAPGIVVYRSKKHAPAPQPASAAR